MIFLQIGNPYVSAELEENIGRVVDGHEVEVRCAHADGVVPVEDTANRGAE